MTLRDRHATRQGRLFPAEHNRYFRSGYSNRSLDWLRQSAQVGHDVFDIVKYFAVVCIAVVSLIAWFNIRLRKRERRFLTERGEQSATDFVALFENESERRAAGLLFKRLRRMTAMGRVPGLGKEDLLHGPPLFLVPDDLNEQIEELCEESDICTALDPDARLALYSATTIAQLVSALGRLIKQQGLESETLATS